MPIRTKMWMGLAVSFVLANFEVFSAGSQCEQLINNSIALALSPDARIEILQENIIQIQDERNRNFSARAELSESGSLQLRLELTRRTERSTLRGKDLLNFFRNFFGNRVRTIQGNWLRSTGLESNLTSFQNSVHLMLRRQGLTSSQIWHRHQNGDYENLRQELVQILETSAFETHTGRMARELWGFNGVAFTNESQLFNDIIQWARQVEQNQDSRELHFTHVRPEFF